MKIKVDELTWRVWCVHRPELQFGHGDQAATTEAFIANGPENQSGSITIHGIATCSPKDAYSRARGRKIALARALCSGGFDKRQRTQFWRGLFGQGMRY